MDTDGDRESPVALLLIDLINPFDYPGAEELLDPTRDIVRPVHALRQRFRDAGLAVVYVNDNFGRWRSSFPETVAHCMKGAGRDVIEALQPSVQDYFVLKPHRSGYYATPLELLLGALRTRRVVLAGISTDMCVLSTASDARIRGMELCVPRDCTATFDDAQRDRTLRVMRHGLDAWTGASTELELPADATSASGRRAAGRTSLLPS